MKYLNKTILELHDLLVKKEVTPYELAHEAIEALKQNQDNACETILEDEALEYAKTLTTPEEDNIFWGIPYVAKDNFSTKGILTTGSSNILSDYKPVFDATVIQKLKDKKAVLIAKSTMDELAMGGSGTTGHKGKTFNPYDPSHTYQIGGSSCGSAALVAAGIVPFALGSDTGDSVRKPASYGGLVGFKPTWGRISRYGLFPFAPSLDHVAYFTRSVEDAYEALKLLQGRDDNDMTSSFVDAKLVPLDSNIKGKRIAVIQEVLDSVKDESCKNAFVNSLTLLQKRGAIINYVHMDEKLLTAIFGTYFVISCAEATSNNANLDGIKFGPRQGEEKTYQDVMFNARSKGFGELIKRRFVIGSYSLFKENQEELFLRAQKARHKIVDAVNDILKDNDVIYLPCAGKRKQAFEEKADRLSNEYLIAENHLAIANFAGLPSITLPLDLYEGFPFGGNITGRRDDEQNVLNIALALEEETGLKNLSAGRK